MSDPYRSICENCANSLDQARKELKEKLESGARDSMHIAISALGIVFMVCAVAVTWIYTKSEGLCCGAFFGAPALYVAFCAIYSHFSLRKAARSMDPGKY